MRYRNCRHELIRPLDCGHGSYLLHCSYNYLYMPAKVCERLEGLRESLEIKSLRDYLYDACVSKRCVIVQRDEETLIMVCNKVRFVVDAGSFIIKDATRRVDKYL